MATKKKSSTLGQILKNEGFDALLERAKILDEKEFKDLVATKENTIGSAKFVSDLDELMFYTTDYYYVKDEEGNNTQLPAPGVFEFIDWAIEKGSTPHIAMKYGISMFLKSAAMQEPSLIQYFIEKTPDIDMHQKDGRGQDAIFYSVKNKSEQVFDYLYGTGEYDINHKYTFVSDKTLLHIACAVADEAIIDKLISFGADLTVLDSKGLYAKDMIPTQLENDLPEDEVTPELVQKWDALALKLEELTQNSLNNKVVKKKYKTSF